MAGPERQAPAGGLRERKQRRTREALYEAAVELFLQQGYEATTLAQIAARADVSPRTFFSYFASKEALLVSSYEPRMAVLPDRLQDRRVGADTIDAVRDWFLDDIVGTDVPDPRLEELADRVLAGRGAVLLAGIAGIDGVSVEEVIAESLAAEVGPAVDAMTVRIAAAATVASLYRATLGPDGVPLTDRMAIEANTDRAVAVVRHGLRALRGAGS